MSLSIEKAYEQQRLYRSSEETRRAIGGISVLMFVGPSAGGKNFLMERSGLPIAGNITSRERREDDDPAVYTYMAQDEILKQIEAGAVVQYGVALPDHIYATAPASFRYGTPNAKDVWYDAVEQFSKAGFRDVKTVSVLAPDQAQFRSQLMLRLDGSTVADAHARLSKDLNSLKWVAAQVHSGTSNNLVVLNRADNVDENADLINRFADGKVVESASTEDAADAIIIMNHVIKSVRGQF